MRRGTTPTLTFTTPYEASLIQDGYITLTQKDVVIEYELSDPAVIVRDKEIQVTLTQTETLSLSEGSAMVQIRATLTGDKKVASDILTFKIGDILKDGEI